ncbi:tape measure protein [Danxiaibacter flavus]|uniref:Tape measure protein n=1 Tax=Danxiaibacter flavus TaxID=3049108 RepID=A0ABV3ZN03_9BACT|nr:tape measure protein [Chitinophagaceae bacterium DXS]
MPVSIGGALEFDAVINMSQFGAQIRRIEAELQGIATTAKNSGAETERYLSKLATAAGAFFSLSAGKEFITNVANVRGEFQQLEVSFRTMLKSKEKADELMSEAVKLAATTPFDLQAVGQGAKQLLAYGFKAQDITKTLTMLGNVASGVSAPLGDIVYLYGTLQTQGRAYTKDIMQFTSRGIPIIDELAKQFGVTKDKVQELVEAGKVGFPEVEKAFQNMTGQGGLFFNLMQEQSKTITGLISNMKDSWSQMLNEIGKANEGTIASVIKLATSAIEHYQDVLDIIKVLIATYGAYKAAVIAATVAERIQGEMMVQRALAGAKLNTMQALGAVLTMNYQRAMDALNKTLLANPYAIVAAAIGTLIAAIVVYRKEVVSAKDATELLKDVHEKTADSYAEQEAKIRPYLEVLKEGNLTEQKRVDIYNKLKEIDPKIIEGINAKKLSYDQLADSVDKYLTNLRKQIAFEANESAYRASVQQENLIKKQIEKQQKLVEQYQKSANSTRKGPIIAGSGLGVGNVEDSFDKLAGANEELARLNSQLKYQEETTKKIGDDVKKVVKETTEDSAKNASAATVKNKAWYDAEIARLKDLQAPLAVASKEYKAYQAQIEKLQDELNPKAKHQEDQESKINTLLEARNSILERIKSVQRDATQSGLIKEQSEIDRINEKYENVIASVEEYNKKVTDFNTKNKTNVKGISLSDIDAINKAKQTEATNAQYKIDSENYLKSLSLKREAFEAFQKIQAEGNEEMTAVARDQYKDQIGDFNSYVDYLKSERSKLMAALAIGGPNVGISNSLLSINQQITEQETKDENDRKAKTIAMYRDLIHLAQSYSSQKAAIEKKYADLNGALDKQQDVIGKEEYDKRLTALKESKAAELAEVENSRLRQTEAYKIMGQDILSLTREQLKQRLDALRETLKRGTTTDKDGNNVLLTPQMKADLEGVIEQGEKFYGDTKEIFGVSVRQMEKIAGYGFDIGSGFQAIGDSLKDINPGLSDTLQTMGEIANVGANALTAVAGFASGNIAAGISGTIGFITGIIKLFSAAKQSQKKALEDLKKYQDDLIKGEIAYNELLRERQRTQEDISKLTVQELMQREKMLDIQKQQAQADYDRLLAQIQSSGQQITGAHTEKYGGFLGIARKTKVVNELAGLSGADYDQLEKLFTEGKLDDATKSWFQELQKVHDELKGIGEDAEAAQEELNQRYTGTTADSIVDGIVDGFSQGLDSAADFADNFQDLMKKAVLNSLKYQTLQKPLEDFYKQFAAATESDNMLTNDELNALQNTYSGIIDNAAQQFQKLQDITNLDFSSNTDTANSVKGAIKGMSEQQADLLAGQFGGMRMTLLDQLNVARQGLVSLQQIELNTSYILQVKDILYTMNRDGIKVK